MACATMTNNTHSGQVTPLGVTEHAMLCNIGYPSEIHLKLKSREISFAHNLTTIHAVVF